MTFIPQYPPLSRRVLFTEANAVIVLHEVSQYLSTQNSPSAEKLSIVVNALLNEAFKNVQNKAALAEYQKGALNV